MPSSIGEFWPTKWLLRGEEEHVPRLGTRPEGKAPRLLRHPRRPVLLRLLLPLQTRLLLLSSLLSAPRIQQPIQSRLV